MLVQDDNVGAQPLQPPVVLSAQRLAHEGEVVPLEHAHEQDGKIARDAVTPESRLAEGVAPADLGRGPQRAVRVEDARGEPLVELRLVDRDAQVTDRDRELGRSKRKGSRRGGRVRVFHAERDRRVPIRCHAGREGEAREPARSEPDALAETQDRIQGRAHGPRQGPPVERDRILGSAAAPEEPHAIGLPLHGTLGTPLQAEHVDGPRSGLVGGPFAASAEE